MPASRRVATPPSRPSYRNHRCSNQGSNSFKDIACMAQLIMAEATASLPNAGRIIGKITVVSLVGFLLASDCRFSRSLVPVGVIILAIAAGWLDAIGNECKSKRFFPYKSLNVVGSYLFRWQWIVFWALLIYALNSAGLVNLYSPLQFAPYERMWKLCVMAIFPLALMLLARAVEPCRFRRARNEIQKAELLVRQLAATSAAADISALAPLIEPDLVPVYKLGRVAKILYDIVANHDATEKLKLDLAQSCGSMRKWTLWQAISQFFSPFRAISADLLMWESRDLVIYATAALYFATVYVAYDYFPSAFITPNMWAIWCILLPFMGPRSKSARYVRALQENIRLAQGVTVEKKGGLDPSWAPQEVLCVVNWPMLVYISFTHLAGLYALVVLLVFGGICPIFGQGAAVKWQTIAFAFILYVCSALGITAGVHRLWSHRSYKAGAPLRFLLMLFNSIANQGSIFHWARDHRVHHLYSDTIADPHDANRGFFFSHVGWLILRENAAVIEATKKINVSDLENDAIVMFQKRADPFWCLLWCFAFPAFTVQLWGDSFWYGWLIAGVLRYVALINATWAVNSVVHAWGSKPYNPAHLTTENGWISLFAIGEGWHNWHHAFSWDYAAAELGASMQFNPTKVFIDGMALLGLAWDRKRATAVWSQRKARWEEAQGRPVMESLEGPPFFKHRVVTFGPAYDDIDAEEEEVDANMVDEE